MGSVQAECQTHFVWREACDPQLASDLAADALERKFIGPWNSGLRPRNYPLTLEKTQRFYGPYSNRGRISVASAEDNNAASPGAKHGEQDISDGSREARSTWARLIKKIFEADPLLCPCGGRMRIVSFISDPRVVDRILRHRESRRCKTRDPFEPRLPPGATAKTPQ
jgi:hypothetical protein